MREKYVRPPLVAREAPSARWAQWRFRLAAMLLGILLIAAAAYTVRELGLGIQDTGGGVGQPLPSADPLDGAAR